MYVASFLPTKGVRSALTATHANAKKREQSLDVPYAECNEPAKRVAACNSSTFLTDCELKPILDSSMAHFKSE